MGRESRLVRFEPKHITAERKRLQDYAALVKDEAHWQLILKSCPTQEDRDSLEREMAPMLAFRRCGNRDCESQAPPLWVPTLLLRVTPDGPVSRAQVLMTVCSPCRERIRVDDVLTLDLWTRICDGYTAQGAPLPEQALTTLTFDAVQ